MSPQDEKQDQMECKIPKVILGIERLNERAKLPRYAHEGDAGMDIYASESVTLLPGESKMIPTGITLRIPQGYEIQVRPRSGLSLNTRLRLPNSPGTIDSGYRDELKILMWNATPDGLHSDQCHSLSVKGSPAGAYRVEVGDRIAQIVLSKLAFVEWVAAEEMDESALTLDREGGFGSSGLR